MKSPLEEIFEQFGVGRSLAPQEIVIEFEQAKENGSIQFETMIPAPQEFDVEEPFVFRIYDNKSNKKNFGVSGNFEQLVNALAAQIQKKPKKPKASQ